MRELAQCLLRLRDLHAAQHFQHRGTVGAPPRARIAAEEPPIRGPRVPRRRGDFHSFTSMIWVPIGNSGLNVPNGSCGMKVMLRPQIPSEPGARAGATKSSPRKRIVPPGHAALPGEDSQDGVGKRGLAAAGLPNEAHDLARPDGEIDAVEDPGGAVPGGIRDEEVFDLDEITGRRPHVEIRRSRTSRNPSPRRLKPITTRKIASPGASV